MHEGFDSLIVKDRGKAFSIKEKNKGPHPNILFLYMEWLNSQLSPSVKIGNTPFFNNLIIIKNIYGQKNKKNTSPSFSKKSWPPPLGGEGGYDIIWLWIRINSRQK